MPLLQADIYNYSATLSFTYSKSPYLISTYLLSLTIMRSTFSTFIAFLGVTFDVIFLLA